MLPVLLDQNHLLLGLPHLRHLGLGQMLVQRLVQMLRLLLDCFQSQLLQEILV